MRITCIANTGADLPEAYKEHGYFGEYEFPILIGKSYVTYGMNIWNCKIRYLIVGETTDIPIWVPSELFEILDSKLSRYWHYGVNNNNSKNTIDAVWGYKELTDNSDHFDRLIDWEKDALEVFLKYKDNMDLEFPNPVISDFAEIIDNGDWLLCPNCNDAWESRSQDGMVKCPSCGTILRNPRDSGQL